MTENEKRLSEALRQCIDIACTDCRTTLKKINGEFNGDDLPCAVGSPCVIKNAKDLLEKIAVMESK